MESVVHSAVEEICSRGANGLALQNLWPKLQHSLSSNGLGTCDDNIKKALWANLLTIPTLRFESRGVSYDSNHPSIHSFYDCEKMELKVVAAEHLRNNFVGIYDIEASAAGVSLPQRRALERLAIARANGITQSDLAKEFGIKGNNIFYILRNLECRGLIVRHSTILRRKEASNAREPKNSSIVSTNMLYLYRYAKHLGCQQRLEITQEDKNNENQESTASGSGFVEEHLKEDVHIKDYLPALKAICDKLEEADGKVLLVSDIKRDLGYRGTSGHRAWRNIFSRLKDAHMVEDFTAKVNAKEVICLRLLKKFSPKSFEPKTIKCGSDDIDMEEPVKLGKRGQINDQILELPIEHQVYDMIDAEGSKGLTITELCKRLGLNNKRYYTRLLNMFSRYGMHLQAESHNRGVAYRVWTSRNFNPDASNTIPSGPDNVDDDEVHIQHVQNPKFQDSTETAQWEDQSASDADALATESIENIATEPEFSQGLPDVGECKDTQLHPNAVQNETSELHYLVPDTELQIVSVAPVSGITSLDLPRDLSTPRRRRSYQKYPCLTLNALSSLREKRILELLQGEKFMIKADLQRQLQSLEKGKNTTMDRKTLERSLNKLQHEGLCKCIRVGVPVVTNCGRSRTMDIILHPSVSDVSPDLLAQIYERVRSFDMLIRGHGSPKLKKSLEVPELNSVQRILNNVNSDVQSERSEAMRANGFVLAKMVRTKLMHTFLWGYLKSLPSWEDNLSSSKHGYDQNNPHSTCKIFELQEAIKAMPLELFLQVAGSTQNFTEMIDKCRNNLLLSDLPVEEYKHLMGTRATGRLSYIIDILRRLKLIRMVSCENSEDAADILQTTLTHALELKPYIEEPVSVVPSPSVFVLLDIRPQIRHDFVLSSRTAVDEYWNTLEYCYAAVDSKAALHAFPGCAVHEVFLFRSWASARVMPADQRAELLNRIENTDPNKKLSFKDCEKIAKELHLTLEQVLRVYYDKQRRVNRLQRFKIPEEEIKSLNGEQASSSWKRKLVSEERTSKRVNVDSVAGDSGMCNNSSDDQYLEEHTSSREQEHHFLNGQVVENMEGMAEFALPEADEDDHSFIPKCALFTQSTRQKRFSWTENADRQLVIEYARCRAALGANFHRADWHALPNLPATPDVCRRRIAVLNSNPQCRKAVMRLCNILTERYAKHLTKFQDRLLIDEECRVMLRDSSSAENISDVPEKNQALCSDDRWDNFDNEKIVIALDEVLRHKRMAKMVASREVYSVSDDHSNMNLDAEHHDPSGTKLVSSATPRKRMQKSRLRSNVSGHKSSYHRLQQKYVKFLNEGVDVNRRAYKSLAVSNAIELFKLVFLSTSTAPEVPKLLAETLRRYSEHDLFAAFNYLREAKIMVGGSGTSPFVLSQQFIHRISSSPYPANTGKRAAKFASWIREKEKNLMEDGIDLPANLQCGDVIYLSAILISRDLVLSPCVPDQGVGEVEDFRMSKRKCDNSELGCNDKAKKPKPSSGDGEIISRREKGFPGIRLSLSRATISRVDAVDLLKDSDIRSPSFLFGGSKHNPYAHIGFSSSDHTNEVLDLGTDFPRKVCARDSLWESMTCFAEHLISVDSNKELRTFSPELFMSVYSAIHKAGDQGLSMEEVSKLITTQGDKVPEITVEVLETFGRALKVNAYDSVHVVDSLYRSKYCLTSLAGLCQDSRKDPPTNSKCITDEENLPLHSNSDEDCGGYAQKYIGTDADDVHRVTILNLLEDVQSSSIIQNVDEIEGCQQASVSPGRHLKGDTFENHLGDSNLCRPILPWINGDGCINDIVYKGLVRRVLGILMQNPGILEVDVLSQMSILNPQSCRKLLELMILDKIIIVRKMHQATSDEPPGILSGLLGSSFKKSKLIFQEHFFVNPVSAATLL